MQFVDFFDIADLACITLLNGTEKNFNMDIDPSTWDICS